ncbi:hypothetical protein AAG906_008428 [Vitis piasezkii]
MTNKPLTLTRQYPRLKTLRFELREAKQKGSFHLPQLSLCVNGEENGERGNGEAAEKISESEKMVLKAVSSVYEENYSVMLEGEDEHG